MRGKWGWAGAIALLMVGCAPLAWLNAFVPRGGYTEIEGQAYGEGPRQRLDVYRPQGQAGPAPVLVFFYGGRWQSGDRADYRFVGQAFAERGYVVVVPDTRLYPEVKYPAFLEDSARAVAWVVANIAAYGGDPERLHLMGHSSGAYNAAMLTLDERWLADVGLSNTRIDATVGLAGPYDFAPFEDADLQDLFGPREGWPATQPIRYADGNDPPMLLLQGAEDDIVQPGNATRLATRLEAEGGQVKVELYPRVEHYKILAALAAPLRGLAPVLEDAATFLQAH